LGNADVLVFIVVLIGAAVRVVRAPTWNVPYASAGTSGRWRRRAPAPEPG
jgi:hypothetical protein